MRPEHFDLLPEQIAKRNDRHVKKQREQLRSLGIAPVLDACGMQQGDECDHAQQHGMQERDAGAAIDRHAGDIAADSERQKKYPR